MSKDAFPKIRLCTVVKNQSGVAPRLCSSWRIHRTVSCQKGLPGSCSETTGAISNPEAASGFQMLPHPGLHVFYEGHSILFWKWSRFQGYWSTRAPLPFPIWVGTSDPRVGTQMSSQLCDDQRFPDPGPWESAKVLQGFDDLRHFLCPTIKIWISWVLQSLFYGFGLCSVLFCS